MTEAHFRRLSWGTLAFIVFVILWGAVVRATGSGAGCGSHWPTCNGEVVPYSPSVETLIELIHRVTSGLSALLVAAQLFFAVRLYERRHRVRRAAGWSLAFMGIEVLIGAGIVLLRYVADNPSMARAGWMAVHLVNTFLLVGASTLTAHFASGGAGFRVRATSSGLLAVASVVGMMLVGMSGAVAALGDTLFPAADLGSALAADLSPAAHVLVRLRIVHPFVAVGVAFLVLVTRFVLASRGDGNPALGGWGAAVRALVVVQMAAGLLNLVLLAPVWMQVVHLLLADLLWIALTLFLAHALVEQEAPRTEATEASAAA